jgi:hypothetical protein
MMNSVDKDADSKHYDEIVGYSELRLMGYDSII